MLVESDMFVIFDVVLFIVSSVVFFLPANSPPINPPIAAKMNPSLVPVSNLWYRPFFLYTGTKPSLVLVNWWYLDAGIKPSFSAFASTSVVLFDIAPDSDDPFCSVVDFEVCNIFIASVILPKFISDFKSFLAKYSDDIDASSF